jgi:hypothetical protein
VAGVPHLGLPVGAGRKQPAVAAAEGQGRGPPGVGHGLAQSGAVLRVEEPEVPVLGEDGADFPAVGDGEGHRPAGQAGQGVDGIYLNAIWGENI